jgi:hypothetical protein
MNLPDFLNLSDEDVKREKQRQERLRLDFNTRAKQSSIELEASRAAVLMDSLIQSVKTAKGNDKIRAKNQLAEAYAAQGQFLKAAQTAADKGERAFYRKAADAVFNGKECLDGPNIHMVDGRNIRLPKHRVIREVNSLKAGCFGFLVECNTCHQWTFMGSNPLPVGDKSDLEMLRA